jgi:hypothetical protein
MTLKEQVEEYRAAMRRFNEWEAEHPAPERDLADVFADIEFLLSWVSEEERRRDPDPEKLGIQRMRAILARARGPA